MFEVIITGDIQRPITQRTNINRLCSIIHQPIKILIKKEPIIKNNAYIYSHNEYLKEDIYNNTVIQFKDKCNSDDISVQGKI